MSALIAETQARAEVYALLANLLAAPPAETLLHALRQVRVPEAVRDSLMGRAWFGLQAAAQNAGADSVAREYQALFIGLGQGEVVPYASWYLSGTLMDKPLAALRADLQRLGLARREEVREPEDHAAAICDTMRAIISENLLCLREENVFFQAHVGSWLEELFQDMRNMPSRAFYKQVGSFGVDFISIEKQYHTD